ncbi:MAG: GTPase HflX [Desulfitobacteriaceae bacterium]|nr:GTPase HflX [Desulfitobacteriaceae bacterium]
MEVKGNRLGISGAFLDRLEKLYDYVIDREMIISRDLAFELAAVTASTNKEVAVYINRRGRVVHVAVGNDYTVPLEELNLRRGQKRLSGLRCIHTHPGGDGTLSSVDLAALEMMRFDCMAALGVKKDGTVSSIEAAFLEFNEGIVEKYYFSSLTEVEQFHFPSRVEEYESNVGSLYHQTDEKTVEKAILIGIDSDKNSEKAEESIDELERLALSAGLVVLAKELQKRNRPDASLYIGRGKAGEIQLIAQTKQADVVVCDDELSPAQQKNLEDIIGIKTIDRTMLILDIFAQRAKSNEGKLQVELAQLKYLLPRLTGQGMVLSRLGGGIGTRGPGETKLEVDRRRIRKRITDLERRLEMVKKARALHRKSWLDKEWPVVALVGYTNAGKSTLMNCLTGAAVLVEDKLFATLDPTTRMLKLPDSRPALLSDTVGFVRKLPHHLVAAFRATLEETVEAAVLLHVIDGSSPQAEEQAQAVHQVLKSLGAGEKPVLTVINKIDLIENDAVLSRLLRKFQPAVAVSAEKNIGMDNLLQKIQEILPGELELVHVFLPFDQASFLTEIHAYGRVVEENYTELGIDITAYLDRRLANVLEKYLVTK